MRESGGRHEMINKLHLAMIELYRGDAKRIQHFCKVHSYAKLIAETENVDKKSLFIIEAAALTHDIGIHFCEEKYGNCNGRLQEQEGPAIAERLLKKLGFDQEVSDRVQYLIAHHHTYNDIDASFYFELIQLRKDIFKIIFDKSLGTMSERLEQIYKKVFEWEYEEDIETIKDFDTVNNPEYSKYDIEYMLKPFEGYEVINKDWFKRLEEYDAYKNASGIFEGSRI